MAENTSTAPRRPQRTRNPARIMRYAPGSTPPKPQVAAASGNRKRQIRITRYAPVLPDAPPPTGDRVPAICNACGNRQALLVASASTARPANVAPKPGDPAPWGRQSNAPPAPVSPPCNACGNRTLRRA